MGKLLARGEWTSEDRALHETKEFVDPIEEVRVDVTSNWIKITNPDKSFFGGTL